MKKIIWIVVLVLILGGIYWWTNKDSQNTKLPAPVIYSNEEVVEMNEMNDWKTYRNEEYGFELQYPGPYATEASLGGLPAADIRFYTSDELYSFRIAVEKTTSRYCSQGLCLKTTIGQSTFNGVIWDDLGPDNWWGCDPGPCNAAVYRTVRGEDRIHLLFIDETQYDQILSTFKFIE